MQAIYINYNIFTALLISLGSLWVGCRLMKNKKNYYALFFGYYWLASFVTYFLVVLMDYNYYLHFRLDARYILGIMQFFVNLMGFFMYAFVILSISRDLIKTKKFIYYLVAPVMLVAFLFLALTKWQGPNISGWGVKYLPNASAALVFNIVVGGLTILLVYSLIRLISQFRRRENNKNNSLLLAHISVSIYLITGMIDEIGLAIGWSMLFFRMIMIIAILLAYFCWPKSVET